VDPTSFLCVPHDTQQLCIQLDAAANNDLTDGDIQMGEGNSDMINKVAKEVRSSGATHSTQELGANQPSVHLDSKTDLAPYHT
jgi:hypothetical protein